MDDIVQNQNITQPQIATARWGDPSYIAEQYPYSPGAIWLGRNPHNENQAIGYKDDGHVFVCAGTRTGKGRALIVNNLLKWPGSIVSVDPKGENATIAALRRGAGNKKYCDGMNQDTYVLDPFRCAKVPEKLRAYYNPLDAIDPDDEELIAKANRIADAICIIPESSGDSADWARLGKEFIASIIAHLVTYKAYSKVQRNLVTACRLILEGEVQGSKDLKEEMKIDLSPFDVLLEDMIENTACNGWIATIARNIKSQDTKIPKYFESVRSNAATQTAFLMSPGIEKTVCDTGHYKRTFDISKLRTSKKGISIFLCLPLDDADPYARWQRAMITVILGEMQKKQGLPANGHPMLVSVDEFQNLGKMDRIERAINEVAGSGVKLMIATQNLGGIQELYKKKWETFLSGASLQIWFGADGPTTKKHLQEDLGQTQIVKVVRSQNASQSMQSTEGETKGHSHTNSTSRSETDTKNWSESENSSKSENWNSGENWSRSENFNESDNWNKNINWSNSKNWGQNQGKQAGKNYGPHIFFKGWEHTDSYSDNSNYSTGEATSKGEGASHGGSKSHGEANTQGGSSTHGGADTHGRASTHGGGSSTTLQTGESNTNQYSEQTSSSKGYQIGGGIAESFHKKPLLAVNEINEYLASPQEIDHLAYPGMALVMISGELPFFVRKSNYDQDKEFVRCFNPNPAYGYTPLEQQPLLGYQYTNGHYLTITIPDLLKEKGYIARPIESIKKNQMVKAGEELLEYTKEEKDDEWSYVILLHMLIKLKEEPDKWGGKSIYKVLEDLGEDYLKWLKVEATYDVKVMHIFEPESFHDNGNIMTLRFNFALDDDDQEVVIISLWLALATAMHSETQNQELTELNIKSKKQIEEAKTLNKKLEFHKREKEKIKKELSEEKEECRRLRMRLEKEHNKGFFSKLFE
ncbi:MAG: type IV secretory system conjugative DNA transfer family protein [Candidatus Scalindua sp.]|jgi:type IV secretory pathway TraG/TraD family ATPase VirD4|nr:type IV secretory system conjugative DNA transfer family protein [Candidatus Scalindua sp.]MBT6564454.1 type IV secretory system conjugative DNA transfer family protein [Candidatus Scalindua sp.]